MSKCRLLPYRVVAACALALAISGCANQQVAQPDLKGNGQFPALASDAARNFLRIDHEKRLALALKERERAASQHDKARASRKVAAQLDSLDRSGEALSEIDRALEMGEAANKDFVATKAAILFSMSDPQGALRLLDPQIERIRQLAAGDAKLNIVYLSLFSEGFITATFAQMQLEQWGEAVKTLADAHSALGGPSFYAYRSVVYRYIMARAKDQSLTNRILEDEAKSYAVRDKSHYGALLRMWQGEDTSAELRSIVARKSGIDRQETLSEVLFHIGAYEKFVRNDPEKGQKMLDGLNQLAPYGSIEWIYGSRVLQ